MSNLSSQENAVKAQNQRILCVDDEPTTLQARKLLLEAAGYSVLISASGEDALKLLADGAEVKLVLLDYMMIGMNGDVLAQELRRLYPDIPLIAVSAVGQLPETLLKAVDRHVQKGRNPELLLSTVSEVLAQSAGQSGEPPLPSEGTVLCVEDEELQLQLRKILFESAGFRVLQARSSAAALELFRSQHIDAVVMDYWLSGSNGTAIAEEMKKLHPRIPIVMLSGFTSLPGEGAVVDAWLRKGEVEPEEIVNEIKRLIGFQSETQQSSIS